MKFNANSGAFNYEKSGLGSQVLAHATEVIE